jgi:uncharacterized protein (TIGR00290 family)
LKPFETWLAWSSGKDSAWALHTLKSDPLYEVKGLLCTVTKDFDRVSMHAVRRALLEQQAKAVRLPLYVVEIPKDCPEELYAQRMNRAVQRASTEGITHMAFGDLFLEDIRAYRERALAGTGIEPLFPLWGRPTLPLAHEMIDSGLKAYITCVDPKKVDPSLAGRPYDRDMLESLPDDADPCAENGEFHTFAWDGPMFTQPVRVRPGPVVERDGFVFADLVEGN